MTKSPDIVIDFCDWKSNCFLSVTHISIPVHENCLNSEISDRAGF